jgi:hypothetical protein
MGYRKFTWVGNRIADKDMAALHDIKQKTKQTITSMVADAVAKYVAEARPKDAAR